MKTKSNFSCLSGNRSPTKQQLNTNNNNNLSSQSTDEQHSLLQFYMINVSRERNLRLSTNPNDKRLLCFYNIPNGLYKMGLRSGDALIFLNDLNVLKPPVALTIDRIKSEFTCLRRQNKLIYVGVCRNSDRSILNNTTIKHLSALTYDEFRNLSYTESLNENQNPSPTSESKKLVNLFLHKKKSTSKTQKITHPSNRDSGFTEIEDHSIISNSNKRQSKTSQELSEEDDSLATQKSFSSSQLSVKKATNPPVNQIEPPEKKQSAAISPKQLLNKLRQTQYGLPTQVLTDACFVYHRQLIKKTTSNAMILRGREIAYQAANSPTIPSTMPNYTDDQVRELYGEIDKGAHRLKQNESNLNKPLIDAWNEKPSWTLSSSVKNQLTEGCPLPKFYGEKQEQLKFAPTYLSTGLSNPRTILTARKDQNIDQDSIRGSFRTSIADRTNISPSPASCDVHLEFNAVTTTSTSTDNQFSDLEKSQQNTTMNSKQNSNDKHEKANDAFGSATDLDQSSLSKNPNEQTMSSVNLMNPSTKNIALLQMKTSETLDMDSLIDLDDETTVSYNTTEEFHVETDPDSSLSVKHNEKLESNQPSTDSGLLTLQNNYSDIMNSPETSYHDDLTSATLTGNQNAFTDTNIQQTETLQHENDPITGMHHEENVSEHQSSSFTIDIDELMMKEKTMQKNSAIDNLLKIIHDTHEEQSYVNDIPTVNTPIIIKIELKSKPRVDHSNEFLLEFSKDNQTEPIETTHTKAVKYQDLLTQSQEFSTEPSIENDNLLADIDNTESSIKFSPECEENSHPIPSSLPFTNVPSPVIDYSVNKNQNENVHSLINEVNDFGEITHDSDQDFEQLYERYLTNVDQYQKLVQQISEFEEYRKALSPIAEESTILFERAFSDKLLRMNDLEKLFTVAVVIRQPKHIGHYGFELEQTIDRKIIVSSIIDSNNCPNLNVNDEIIGIDNTFILTSLEQCYLLFNSLWYNEREYVQIFINKTQQQVTTPDSELISFQSSSLSWPLSMPESDLFVGTNTYTEMPGANGDLGSSSYKSQITARSTNIQRHPPAGSAQGVMTRMYQFYSSNGAPGASGLLSLAGFSGIPLRASGGSSALVAINETREREKRDLSQLNDKFAQYVEKVRFLEAQNRKLQLELDALQKKSGQGSSKIKEMFEIEMSEAKKLVTETNRDRDAAEIKARQAEEAARDFRKRYDQILSGRDADRLVIDRIQQQIAENEAQINLFRRRLADLEDESRRYKAETQRLATEIARLQTEIQNETFLKSTLDTEKIALEDELSMIKQTHEAELTDLRAKTVVDVNIDPSRFFRNELAQAIRDIRQEFEARNEQQRSELHNRYMMSYNELVIKYQKPELGAAQANQQLIQEEKLRSTLLSTRNEVAHMKAKNEELQNRIKEIKATIDQERSDGDRVINRRLAEIQELTNKLEKLKREYEEVSTLKVSLEKEINTYRELLEGTGNREGLKQIVDHVMEEARRVEVEKVSSAQTAGALTHSAGTGGTIGRTTVHRTIVTSSASGPTQSVIGVLHENNPQAGGFSTSSSASSSSYQYRGSYQEQS